MWIFFFLLSFVFFFFVFFLFFLLYFALFFVNFGGLSLPCHLLVLYCYLFIFLNLFFFFYLHGFSGFIFFVSLIALGTSSLRLIVFLVGGWLHGGHVSWTGIEG